MDDFNSSLVENITSAITTTVIAIVTGTELNENWTVSSSTENPTTIPTTTGTSTESSIMETQNVPTETTFPPPTDGPLHFFTTTISPTTFRPDRNHHNYKKHVRPGGYDPHFGKVEAAVIICFVAIVLFIAAKYIGCKPSYFCISWDSFKLSRPRADGLGYHRNDHSVLSRPEYIRTLQYAVYSRPSTAHINNLANTDVRGYGYGYDGEEEGAVKVFARPEDHIIDPPPEYDSLVPPAYNATATGYSNANYYTFETSQRMGDVRL